MKSLARRLQALMLTLIFLGGGTSVPSLDVLLFHLHGEASQTTAHIETDSGCNTHVGHCGVGCPASASHALGVQVVTSLPDIAPPSIAPRSVAGITRQNTCGVGFHSRAPPTPLS